MLKQILIIALLWALVLIVSAFMGEEEPPEGGMPDAKLDGELIITPPMHTARAAHTATLLPNGTVLIAGGFAEDRERNPFANAELYDPEQNVFEATGSLLTGRQSHSATVLEDGKVLIAGGYDGRYLASAELYDPATGTFSPTGSLTVGRIAHRATRLADGRVLITGGATAGGERLAGAELYDPATGLFSPAGAMNTARIGHTQTLLADGSVLITGGSAQRRGATTVLSSAEVYESSTGTFRSVGEMKDPRHKHAAVLMKDGRVLVVGGSDERDGRGRYDSAEVYDPTRGAFTPTGRLHRARFKLRTAVTVLPNGTVFVAGGSDVLELYDPEAERFDALANRLDTARFFSTATLLYDGRVLIAGGYNHRIQSTSKAWIYKP